MADDESLPPPLKVAFEQSGGFAGLVKGCVLDAGALPADESAELRRLVAASGLVVSSAARSRGVHDRRQYAITIERGGKCVEIVCDDGCTPETARPLVAFLAARARPQRP
jgi:hypothetical protein